MSLNLHKIQGARMMTLKSSHTENPPLLGPNVHNLPWRHSFPYHCISGLVVTLYTPRFNRNFTFSVQLLRVFLRMSEKKCNYFPAQDQLICFNDCCNVCFLHGMNWIFKWFAMVYLLTYLLTPWSRVLEKLTGSQLVKKFPTYSGTRRFITAFTRAPLPVPILSFAVV